MQCLTSDVFAARCVADGKRVVIKVIDLEPNPTGIQSLRQELLFDLHAIFPTLSSILVLLLNVRRFIQF
jgi:hypothetical protein